MVEKGEEEFWTEKVKGQMPNRRSKNTEVLADGLVSDQ